MNNRVVAEPQTNYERFQMERYGNVLVERETNHMVDDEDFGGIDVEQMALINLILQNEAHEDRNDD